MNIFFIDENPIKAARWYCDRHASKMVLEFAQILSSNFNLQGIEAPYKSFNPNHPSTKWVRTSKQNYEWFMTHALTLCAEKIQRFGTPHKSQAVIEWAWANTHKLNLPDIGLTKFAIAINEDKICRTLPEFDESDPVNCYRLYYIHDKKHIHQWKQNKPNWIL
jgi:hypothetical protein